MNRCLRKIHRAFAVSLQFGKIYLVLYLHGKDVSEIKAKPVLKILLDFTMLILFSVLVFGYDLNPFFHEVFGFGIFALFILHLIFNIPWFRAVAKGISAGTLNAKNTIYFILDSIFTLGILTILVSSPMISRFVVPGISSEISASALQAWVLVHDVSSYICFGVMILHTLLHVKFLIAVIKNMFRNVANKAVWRSAAGFTAAAGAAFFLYYQAQSAFDAGLAADSLTESSSSASSENSASSIGNSSSETYSSEQQSSISSSQSETSTVTPSLTDYLGGLFCNGCHKHCPLLYPQCSIGERQAVTAEAQYYSTYGVTE